MPGCSWRFGIAKTGQPHCVARTAATCLSLTEPRRTSRSPISPPSSFCSPVTSLNWALVNKPWLIRISPSGIRETWVPCSTPDFRSSESFFSAADVKQSELQYQASCILIPALRADNCRKASDRWQVWHLEVTIFSPATQVGVAMEWVGVMYSFSPAHNRVYCVLDCEIQPSTAEESGCDTSVTRRP